MTTAQMKYFIELAHCLNFTKAAEQLYISQPSLSRHISLIEAELNTQLFLRSKNKVYLTPAGEMLLAGIEKLYGAYNDLIDQIYSASEDLRGTINIGLLEEIILPDAVKRIITILSIHDPKIDITLTTHSFKSLTDGLYNGCLDLIITLANDLHEKNGIVYKVLETLPLCLMVPSKHPLAVRKKIDIREFGMLLKDENFILISPEDSKVSANAVLEDCKRAGLTPKYRYAPTAGLLSVWVAAGQGITIVNKKHAYANNPDIKLIPIDGLGKSEFVIAWTKPAENPNVLLFLKKLNEIV